MTQTMQNSRLRMELGARNYAAFDRSDPFALARALTHTRNGIAGGSTKDGLACAYSADEYPERRTIIGSDGEAQDFYVTAYRNIVRP